jgi:hypothetical protein
MACLCFFGLATSVRRYDYGNSELNFAISWLRGLAKIVKNQVLRRYQMRIKGLKSRGMLAQISGDQAEFWPQRLFAFELRRCGDKLG